MVYTISHKQKYKHIWLLFQPIYKCANQQMVAMFSHNYIDDSCDINIRCHFAPRRSETYITYYLCQNETWRMMEPTFLHD